MHTCILTSRVPCMACPPLRSITRSCLTSLLLSLLLCIFLPLSVTYAQPPAAPPATSTLSPELLARIHDLIRKRMESSSIPGLSAAIGIDGSLAWTEGFGMADLENQVPATPQTIYRLASISKPITAIAAMKLVEAGKLDLDAPVSTYVPEFPEKQAPITMRLLLCHQAGIRHYKAAGEIDSTRHYTDLIDALAPFAKDDLVAQPGTKFNYSTFGYVLAGAAIQRAAGKPFMEYVHDVIAIPGFEIAIRADDSRAIIPHRARGYAKAAPGTIENCHLADTSNKIPGGGMCSRAQDLVTLALALAEGKILSPQSLTAMWTALPTRDGTPTTYGLGWAISPDGNHKRVLHSGGQQGTSTCLVLYPDLHLAVAVMCNLEDAPAPALASEIAKLIADSAPNAR